MNVPSTLLDAAATVPASSWDNPHEASQWLFGAAVAAFVVAALFFGDAKDRFRTILAMIPGMAFLAAGIVIYLFG